MSHIESIGEFLNGYTARTLTEKYGADSIKLIEDLGLLTSLKEGNPEMPNGTLLSTDRGDATVLMIDHKYYVIMINGFNRWSDTPFHDASGTHHMPRLSDLKRACSSLHVFGFVSGFDSQDKGLGVPVTEQTNYVEL